MIFVYRLMWVACPGKWCVALSPRFFQVKKWPLALFFLFGPFFRKSELTSPLRIFEKLNYTFSYTSQVMSFGILKNLICKFVFCVLVDDNSCYHETLCFVKYRYWVCFVLDIFLF